MFERNLHTIQVPVQQITVGMYVSDLDRPWLGSPFDFQGFEITSHEEILLISKTCEYIYIDVKNPGTIRISLTGILMKTAAAQIIYLSGQSNAPIKAP
jgi:hypothetical protein